MSVASDPSQRFLLDEFWQLSWSASVQRAGIYQPGQTSDRHAFRREIIEFIEAELIPQYHGQSPMGEQVHTNNIQALVDHGTQAGETVLGPDGYRWGIAQKLLNLQLKYLWCAGWIPIPPHCPVDRIVVMNTRLSSKPPAWTRIRTAMEYEDIMSAIREEASSKDLSIAAWELGIYNQSVKNP